MNIGRPLTLLVIACLVGAFGLPIMVLRAYFAPQVFDVSCAISPDDRWIATVTRTIDASLFPTPTQEVQIRPNDLSRLWTRAEILSQVDEKGDKPLNVMFEVRWPDAHTLQVSVSKRAEKFYSKESRYDDIAIQYTTMPAQP